MCRKSVIRDAQMFLGEEHAGHVHGNSSEDVGGNKHEEKRGAVVERRHGCKVSPL